MSELQFKISATEYARSGEVHVLCSFEDYEKVDGFFTFLPKMAAVIKAAKIVLRECDEYFTDDDGSNFERYKLKKALEELEK